jgi:hypothetical protein
MVRLPNREKSNACLGTGNFDIGFFSEAFLSLGAKNPSILNFLFRADPP